MTVGGQDFEHMFVITTIGTDNATKTVLPFVTGKGAMNRDETVSMFTMQEATRLGTSQENLEEIKAPGLPNVAELLAGLRENDALEEFIVCEPCATARGITEDDLVEWAEFGSSTDIARLADEHDTTVTF
jgi:predicted peroxiredoxin